MGVNVDYHLRSAHLPLVDVADALPELTLSVTVGQPNQGGSPPFVVSTSAEAVDSIGDAFTRLEAAFDASAFVAESVLLTDIGTSRRYRIRPATAMEEQLRGTVDDVDRLRALAANPSTVQQITVTPTGWRQVRWFADREALAEYVAFWRENGSSISITRLSEMPAGDSDAVGLTGPQREALLTAYEMGYFEIPRTTSMAAIADRLGVSAPAVSERLRRAQTRVVKHLLATNALERTRVVDTA